MAPSSPYTSFLELTLFIRLSSIALYAYVSATLVGRRLGCSIYGRETVERAQVIASRIYNDAPAALGGDLHQYHVLNFMSSTAAERAQRRK